VAQDVWGRRSPGVVRLLARTRDAHAYF
jgi:hypothetical protein